MTKFEMARFSTEGSQDDNKKAASTEAENSHTDESARGCGVKQKEQGLQSGGPQAKFCADLTKD